MTDINNALNQAGSEYMLGAIAGTMADAVIGLVDRCIVGAIVGTVGAACLGAALGLIIGGSVVSIQRGSPG